MKLREIEVYRVDLPYAGGTYRLSGGRTYTGFDATLVCLRTDTGLEGGNRELDRPGLEIEIHREVLGDPVAVYR